MPFTVGLFIYDSLRTKKFICNSRKYILKLLKPSLEIKDHKISKYISVFSVNCSMNLRKYIQRKRQSVLFLSNQLAKSRTAKCIHYRPQTKFAKVMFSQVFACLGDLCSEGGLSRGLCRGGGCFCRAFLCLAGVFVWGRVSVQTRSLSS